jgi:hypothetical protein
VAPGAGACGTLRELERDREVAPLITELSDQLKAATRVDALVLRGWPVPRLRNGMTRRVDRPVQLDVRRDWAWRQSPDLEMSALVETRANPTSGSGTSSRDDSVLRKRPPVGEDDSAGKAGSGSQLKISQLERGRDGPARHSSR